VARPLSELSKGPPNSVYPTGGMGLSLDDKGKVPAIALAEASREVGATGQPAYEGTWVAFDSRGAHFYKDAAGRVHLEGVIKLGTIGTTAFTLPEGYRPRLGTRIFVVDSNTAFGRVTIDTAGQVVPVTGNNAYVVLDGISFRAA
jgi:hypothetical protein